MFSIKRVRCELHDLHLQGDDEYTFPLWSKRFDREVSYYLQRDWLLIVHDIHYMRSIGTRDNIQIIKNKRGSRIAEKGIHLSPHTVAVDLHNYTLWVHISHNVGKGTEKKIELGAKAESQRSLVITVASRRRHFTFFASRRLNKRAPTYSHRSLYSSPPLDGGPSSSPSCVLSKKGKKKRKRPSLIRRCCVVFHGKRCSYSLHLLQNSN